jgi:hypothetical protein
MYGGTYLMLALIPFQLPCPNFLISIFGDGDLENVPSLSYSIGIQCRV